MHAVDWRSCRSSTRSYFIAVSHSTSLDLLNLFGLPSFILIFYFSNPPTCNRSSSFILQPIFPSSITFSPYLTTLSPFF